MPKMIFLNLPVKDLSAATRFYEAIGCKKNEQFSDAKASSMVWSDESGAGTSRQPLDGRFQITPTVGPSRA